MARAKVVSESLLEEMRRAEERGREWAYHRERPFVRIALKDEVVRPMMESLESLLKEMEKIKAGVPEKGDEFEAFVKRLRRAVDEVEAAMYYEGADLYECVRTGVPIGECTSIDESVVRMLRRVDEASERLFGRRCTWLLGVKEPYTFSALLNDLTACYHRAIDFLSKHQVEIETEGKCSWVKGADEKWVELCKEWNAITERLNELELYNPGDYEALEGVVLKDRAEFRVGSAEGHKVHIDFSKRKRVLEYYDKDEEVNGIIRYLLECFAVEGCEYMNEDGREIGVRCWWDKEWDDSALPKIAEILAFATSMDFRISDTLYYWPKALTEYVKDDVDRMEEVMRVLIDTCDDIEEREKRLVEMMINE